MKMQGNEVGLYRFDYELPETNADRSEAGCQASNGCEFVPDRYAPWVRIEPGSVPGEFCRHDSARHRTLREVPQKAVVSSLRV
jgi:hypothetical protein